MLHVKQITDIMQDGRLDEATDAIDSLLAIGPNNIAALKMQALLFESEGNFSQEARIWERIIKLDPSDLDAVYYLQRRQIEDREHFFFSVDAPKQGRKFIVYPRALIAANFMALAGCCLFLFISMYSEAKKTASGSLPMPELAYSILFLALVAVPWIRVFSVVLTTLRSICVDQEKLSFHTLLRKHVFQWSDIENISLRRKIDKQHAQLDLVVRAKNKKQSIALDLSPGSSVIRARPYFLALIKEHYGEITTKNHGDVELKRSSTLFF